MDWIKNTKILEIAEGNARLGQGLVYKIERNKPMAMESGEVAEMLEIGECGNSRNWRQS